MLKPSCWCMQSFLPLPYPFTWCLMPFFCPEGMFLVCPSLSVDFIQPSSHGWVAVAQSVLWCANPALCAQAKLKSWGGTLRGSFTFQGFPGCQFDHFFALNFSLQLHLVLQSSEALVLDPDNSSPRFSVTFKGRKNPHNAYFISRYPHSSALLGSLLCPGFPNPTGGWAALGLKPCLATKCILKPCCKSLRLTSQPLVEHSFVFQDPRCLQGESDTNPYGKTIGFIGMKSIGLDENGCKTLRNGKEKQSHVTQEA